MHIKKIFGGFDIFSVSTGFIQLIQVLKNSVFNSLSPQLYEKVWKGWVEQKMQRPEQGFITLLEKMLPKISVAEIRI